MMAFTNARNVVALAGSANIPRNSRQSILVQELSSVEYKESISGRRSTRAMYMSRIGDNFSGSWRPTDLALPKFNSCNIDASAKQTKLTVPSSPEICSVSLFSLARHTNKCFLCLNPSLDLGF
jgi:hypothetical protein